MKYTCGWSGCDKLAKAFFVLMGREGECVVRCRCADHSHVLRTNKSATEVSYDEALLYIVQCEAACYDRVPQ